jgi:starvation-inducible DNA-binding protein
MKPSIGLKEKAAEAVVNILNAILADEYVLYTKTRNYHWNVTGPHFSELHSLFERQYEELDDIIDEVAERAKALGGRAIGTLREMLDHARLDERPGTIPHYEEMVEGLALDHEKIIRQLRGDVELCQNEYGDAGTTDFLTGLMERHEKMAWMLRATASK